MPAFSQLEVERAALSGTPDTNLEREVLQYVGTVLGLDAAWIRRERYEARIKFALHLAPRSALRYAASNPRPREEVIAEHLMLNGRTRLDATTLGREVADVLDRWEMDRRSVSSVRPHLLRKQHGRCATCRVQFRERPVTLLECDPYKPYSEAPDELLRPEVDHIVPVSTFGSNLVDNLQALCRLCNLGKSDLRGISIRDEVAYAGVDVAGVPRGHRIRMFFAVIDTAAGRCSACASDAHELTIRPKDPHGGFVLSNLIAVCVRCARLQ